MLKALPKPQEKIIPRTGNADNTSREESMKTIEEFMRRLQNDPEFEQKANAFEDSDEFMNFVRNEGYDFSLDQLMVLFKGEKLTEPTPTPSPVPAPGVEAFIQRLEEDPEFERQARAFDNDEAFMKFAKDAGYDFDLDQLTAGLKQGPEAVSIEDQDLPTSIPVQEPSLQQSPSSESPQQTASSPPDDQAQKPLRKLFPRFEGGGGRKRGMKWSSVD